MVATLRCASEGDGDAVGWLELEYSNGTHETVPEYISQRSEFLKYILTSDSNCEERITLLPVQEQSVAAWMNYLRLHDEQKQVATNGYLLNALQVR
jgi:hypothetical protein